MIAVPRLTVADLHFARARYGGVLQTHPSGTVMLVGAVISGTPVDLGPVSDGADVLAARIGAVA